MNILQVVPYFPPEWTYGGLSRLAYELSVKLAERGHGVTVYTTNATHSPSGSVRAYPIGGVKIRRFRNVSHYLARNLDLFVAPGILLAEREDLAQFDVVHLHGIRNTLSVAICHRAHRLSTPVILEAHGSLSTKVGRSFLKRAFDAAVGPRVLKCVTKAVANSRTEAQTYNDFGISPDMITILPNALSTDMEAYKKPSKAFRRKFGIEAKTKIILYLGRLHETKRIDLLIDAFKLISDRHGNVLLAVVGPDDGHRAPLRRQISRLTLDERVLLTGFVSRDLKLSALSESDVLVVPSFTGFPITFLEACAFGTPIITTEESDDLDWVHENVGYVSSFDAESLATAVANVLFDEEKRLQFGRNGKRLIRERFSWDRVLSDFTDLYRSCLT